MRFPAELYQHLDDVDNGLVGVVLIGWTLGDDDQRRRVALVADRHAPSLPRFEFDDSFLALASGPLTAPAQNEALAAALANDLATLDIDDDSDEPTGWWALASAVGSSGDSAADIIRFLDHAYRQCEMLGGRHAAHFDDADRELIA